MKKLLFRSALTILSIGIIAFVKVSIPAIRFLSTHDISRVRNLVEPTKFTDRNGNRIERVDGLDWVRWSELPEFFRAALIRKEDARFFEHFGVDIFSLPRIALSFLPGRGKSGASTITMQVARKVYDGLLEEAPGQILGRLPGLGESGLMATAERKAAELWVSIALERELSKEEILEIYTNVCTFHHGSERGVSVATRKLFGKNPSTLNEGEMILLISFVNRPIRAKYREKWERYARDVFDDLYRNGWLKEPFPGPFFFSSSRSAAIPATTPHYWALREARWEWTHSDHGENLDAGYVVTTLDQVLQNSAARALEGLPDGVEGAIVVIDSRTGAIRALNGGRSKNAGCRATLAVRPLASCIKPFIYLSALDSGVVNRSTIVRDEPVDGNWPRNEGRGFHGFIPLEQAVWESLNPPVVRLASDGRVRLRMLSIFEEVGIPQPSHRTDYLGRGGMTLDRLTATYALIANRGMMPEPHIIEKIIDRTGKVTFRAEPSLKAICSPEAADEMLSMMRGVVTDSQGTARRLNAAFPHSLIYAKTGTSSFDRRIQVILPDLHLSIGVWVGCDRPAELPREATAIRVAESLLRSVLIQEFTTISR